MPILPSGAGQRTKGTWGGARNSAGRTSDAITLEQAAKLRAAAYRALAIGLPLNRLITIHFGALGILDSDAAAATRRYLKWVGDYVRCHGGRLAHVWQRENDDGDGSKGSHVHILAHIPPGVRLSGRHRVWTRQLADGRFVAGAIRTDRIGGTANAWRTSPNAYCLNLDYTLGYVLKGASAETAQTLGLRRKEQNPAWGVGGVVIGKRGGRSQNLANGDGTADRRTGRKRLFGT